MKKLIVLSMLLLCISCTDATKAGFKALGNPAKIKCYSGGVLIYEGNSTGCVMTNPNSAGWEFEDVRTGKFMRVSGTCVIEN